jgi:hypothetical protein
MQGGGIHVQSVGKSLSAVVVCAVVFAAAAIGAVRAPAAAGQHEAQAVRTISESMPTSMTVTEVSQFVSRRNEQPEVWNIANAALARRVYEDILNLRPFPKGTINCPADMGPDYTIVFEASGKVLATAVADASGCNAVRMDGRTYWGAGPGAQHFWDALAQALHRTRQGLRINPGRRSAKGH